MPPGRAGAGARAAQPLQPRLLERQPRVAAGHADGRAVDQHVIVQGAYGQLEPPPDRSMPITSPSGDIRRFAASAAGGQSGRTVVRSLITTGC